MVTGTPKAVDDGSATLWAVLSSENSCAPAMLGELGVVVEAAFPISLATQTGGESGRVRMPMGQCRVAAAGCT